MMEIKYKKTGRKIWKYELTEDATFQLETKDVYGDVSYVETDWYSIKIFDIDGKKYIKTTGKTGYAWDGLTGFKDRKEWLPAALNHDINLQAVHDDKLLPKSCLNECHRLMRNILKTMTESGWANLIYGGLLAFHKPWNWIKSHV